MKLGLLPLFKPESFGANGFSATGMEYFSANALAEIIGFVQTQFPQIKIILKLALAEMLSRKPDLVLLWSTSSCFGQVQPTAESLKVYLGVQVWLAGPHISYLPQSLPKDVDLGIIGEVELPLQQLLNLWLKQRDAGPMQYRRVPGIIYQSRGRVYSGSPAQIVPQLSQLPQPNYRAFLGLPGFSAPIVRSARSSENLLTALAFPPSRKLRLQHPEHLCKQFEQIAENYAMLYQPFPFPKEYLHYICPVFIPDYQFLLHRQRLEALVPSYLARNLHTKMFLIPNLPPEAVSAELFALLKSINTRKVLLLMGPFGHRNPLLPAWTPEQLETTLELCQQYKIGVLGSLFLNPDVGTTRRQLAQTYLQFRELAPYFEKLHASVIGPTPGTPAFEQYLAKHKPDADALTVFPWASLDGDTFSPNMPLFHTSLERRDLQEIHFAFTQLAKRHEHMLDPLKEDMMAQARYRLVHEFLYHYWQPGERILEVPVWPEAALKPVVPNLGVDQILIRKGRLSGSPPQQADLIVLSASLNALRDPEAALAQLKSWLKPGGRMVLNLLNPLQVATLTGFLSWEPDQSSAKNRILKYIKPEELEAMLARSGLELVNSEYTIMEGVETIRPTVETLAARLEYHGSLRIPQHLLYVSEIKMLVRNRS